MSKAVKLIGDPPRWFVAWGLGGFKVGMRRYGDRGAWTFRFGPVSVGRIGREGSWLNTKVMG